MSNETVARTQIVELGRALYDRGITPGRTGNLSGRVGERVLMTPTNVSLGRLSADALSVLDVRDGRHAEGPPPSKEWALHRALYARGACAVAHVHSTHAVAVSLLAEVDPAEPLPALTAYYVLRVGPMPLLPYFPPADPALADSVRVMRPDARAALLANHGSIVGADGLEAAVDAVEEIEETAKLFLLLHGRAIRPLTAEQAADTRKGLRHERTDFP